MTGSLKNTPVENVRTSSFEALPFPIIVLDSQTHVLDMNSSAELLFDQGVKAALGRKLDHWLVETCGIFTFLATAMSGYSSRAEQDLKLDFKQGRTVTVSARMAPIEHVASADKGPVFALALFLPVGGDAMPRQKVDESRPPLASMVSMLAHEIKNPLSGIKGAAQLLELSTENEDRELATMISDEVDRLNKLVDEMEVFGDSRKLSLSRINIHSILNHCHNLAVNGFASGIRIQTVFDPSLPEIMGDADLLTQVFLNIIKNAAESLQQDRLSSDRSLGEKPDVSKVLLQTSFFAGVKVLDTSKANGAPKRQRTTPFLVASVEDNGPGVPVELQSDLFQPSVTSKRGGKGLGLALASKIVSDHGGWIDFSSADHRTRFNVYLPLSTAGEK